MSAIRRGEYVVRVFFRPRVLRVYGPRMRVTRTGRRTSAGWLLAGPVSDKVVTWDTATNLRDPDSYRRFKTLREARAFRRTLVEPEFVSAYDGWDRL